MKPIDPRRSATTKKFEFKKEIAFLVMAGVLIVFAVQPSLFFPDRGPAGRVLVTSTYQPPGTDQSSPTVEQPTQTTKPEPSPQFNIVSDPVQSIQPNIVLFIIFSVITNILILLLLLVLVRNISGHIETRAKINQPISSLGRPNTKSIQEEVSS